MGSTQSVGQSIGNLILNSLKGLGLKIWNASATIWLESLLCAALYIFHSLLLCLISLAKR